MNLTLNKNLDLRSVAQLKSTLEEALDSGEDIVLEIGGVEQADTSSLQLIAAFARALAAGGRKLEIQQKSDVFFSNARRLGLVPMLGLSGAQE